MSLPVTAGQGDEDPDIVVAMLREVLDLKLVTPAQAADIERRLKERYGDRRIRVKKKLQFSDARSNGVGLSDELRVQVYRDGLTSMSNEEITRKHGVSRATVYRWMKTPPKQ